MSPKFEIKYTNETTADSLWIKISPFLFTSVISEAQPNLVTTLGMEAQKALLIDDIVLDAIHGPGMTQRDRFLALKQIVESTNKMEKTSIEKFLNILINLDAFKSISERIRVHIQDNYSVEIIDKNKEPTPQTAAQVEPIQRNIGIVLPAFRELQEDAVDTVVAQVEPSTSGTSSSIPSYFS